MPEPIAAYWILLVGALMPYPLVSFAKAGPAYDNTDPRNPAALTTRLKKEAYGAHANCLEVFPFFAAAVLLAGFRHAPVEAVNIAAWIWLAARLIYVVCYLAGQGTLRSLIWMVGAIANIAILVMAITRGGG